MMNVAAQAGQTGDTGVVVESSTAQGAAVDPLVPTTLHPSFAELPDPCVDRAKRHELLDIVTIAIGAELCGADSWVEVEPSGTSKAACLCGLLVLPHEMPAHDTVGRVFAALDPTQFEQRVLGWVQTHLGAADGGTIAVDGKTLRRAHDRASGRHSLHLVGTWATEPGLMLGQVATDAHSNEITAIPVLLETLILLDRVVSIDALGCQTDIAAQILACGDDSVLALKENQPTLHDLVPYHFAVGAADPGIWPRTQTP